jgi:hypothetical protein
LTNPEDTASDPARTAGVWEPDWIGAKNRQFPSILGPTEAVCSAYY